MTKLTRMRNAGWAPSQYQFERQDLGEIVYVAERERPGLFARTVRWALLVAAHVTFAVGAITVWDTLFPLPSGPLFQIPAWAAVLMTIIGAFALDRVNRWRH